MQSVEYGFNTSVKRSGHAACWCAALGGIVQFGGWPPSEQLSEVVRHEGSNCPLFYMPVTTVARHMHRADQRRGVDALEVALTPHRLYRLHALLAMTACGAADAEALSPAGEGNVVKRIGAASPTAVVSPSLSTRSLTTEEASERGLVYDEGYVSDVEESEADDDDEGSSADADSSAAAAPPSTSSPQRTAPGNTAAVEGAVTSSSGGGAAAAASSLPPTSLDLLSPAQGVVAPTITVELLRQAAEESADRASGGAFHLSTPGVISATASHGHTSVSRSTLTGPAVSTRRGIGTGGHPAVEREAPPLLHDTQAVLGKFTVRPLRWQVIQPHVAPRTRHGHHLVSCGDRLYVVGGSYWAHGNALASTDMMYDVHKRLWQQVSSLFPPRFCAALARSNAVPAAKWMPATWGTVVHAQETNISRGDDAAAAPTTQSGDEYAVPQPVLHDDQVLYYFGGLNYSRQLTNTLYRLWLPQETLEELPQYGAVPRAQFKGILICDVQRECNPAERKSGERSLGRLFYLDGLQEGRPMVPYLRVYNVATCVWVRVCPSPDLVRSQVSLLQYEKEKGGEGSATRLRRFEVIGGMPSRRGKQRRSRMCYAFDAVQLCFDYSNALRVPGLTAHCVVLLPAMAHKGVEAWGERSSALLADGVTTVGAYHAALHVLHSRYGVWSLCCGGNEDWSEAEQNSLGVPVGWLYLFTPRSISLSEAARVRMECLRIPTMVLGAQKDELLEELF